MNYEQDERREVLEWKLNHESAIRTHAAHRNDAAMLFQAGLSFGLEARRTAILVNGGAVVAMMAFIGATYNSPSSDVESLRAALLLPAFIFAAGAVVAGMASGFAYFAQYLYHEVAEAREMHWERPFIRDTRASASPMRWGMFWHVLCVIAVPCSYVLLTSGLTLAYLALS